MHPCLCVQMKIDNHDKRLQYLAIYNLLERFNEGIFLFKTDHQIVKLDGVVVEHIDAAHIMFPFDVFRICMFRKCKWELLYKYKGILYIQPGNSIYHGKESMVPRCTFDARFERFIGEIGRNKNAGLKPKRTTIKITSDSKKHLHPRTDISLLRFKYNPNTNDHSRAEFRIGKENDVRFAISTHYPNDREEFSNPLYQRYDALPYSVQAQDDVHSTISSNPRRVEKLTVNNDYTVSETVDVGESSRYPEYQTQKRRLESFTLWPHPADIQDYRTMAKHGLFFTGPRDLVRCYHCGIGLKDWSFSDDPMFEHIRYSPKCQHLVQTIDPEILRHYTSYLLPGRNQDQSNSNRLILQNGPSTASVETYRHPEYINHTVRVASFSKWPRDLLQTPENLAEAGFYYTGMQDVVRCFACDGGLQHWDPEDDPWVEHARWFPQCPHVVRVKGQEYINIIRLAMDQGSGDEEEANAIAQDLNNLQMNNENGSDTNQQHYQQQQPRKESEDPICSPAAQSVIAFGYAKAAVRVAIEECNKKRIRWKAEDLLNVLIDMEDQGKILPTDSPRPESPIISPQIDMSTKEGLLEERSMLLSKLKCIR